MRNGQALLFDSKIGRHDNLTGLRVSLRGVPKFDAGVLQGALANGPDSAGCSQYLTAWLTRHPTVYAGS
jgi:hypothetical protein